MAARQRKAEKSGAASELRRLLAERVPEALSGAMANMMYLATFETEEELFNYFSELCQTKD